MGSDSFVLDAFSALLFIGYVMDVVVSAAPVWGPFVLAGAACVVVWRRRVRVSGRRRRSSRGRGGRVRTAVRPDARTGPDTRPPPAPDTPLICAGTAPEVSPDTGPDVSGHDETGDP